MMEPRPRLSWDFSLMLATLALLAALGVQSLLGTLWVWWAQRADPGWTQRGYPGYLDAMNAIALPLLVALVAVLGLCVPKRLFARRPLVIVSALMLAAAVGVWVATGDLALALSAYLGLASLIQVAVVALTVAGAPSLQFLSEGRLTKVGSGLLHLGFLLFGIAAASLRGSPWLMPVFALSAVCILGGSALAFWAR